MKEIINFTTRAPEAVGTIVSSETYPRRNTISYKDIKLPQIFTAREQSIFTKTVQEENPLISLGILQEARDFLFDQTIGPDVVATLKPSHRAVAYFVRMFVAHADTFFDENRNNSSIQQALKDGGGIGLLTMLNKIQIIGYGEPFTLGEMFSIIQKSVSEESNLYTDQAKTLIQKDISDIMQFFTHGNMAIEQDPFSITADTTRKFKINTSSLFAPLMFDFEAAEFKDRPRYSEGRNRYKAVQMAIQYEDDLDDWHDDYTQNSINLLVSLAQEHGELDVLLKGVLSNPPFITNEISHYEYCRRICKVAPNTFAALQQQQLTFLQYASLGTELNEILKIPNIDEYESKYYRPILERYRNEVDYFTFSLLNENLIPFSKEFPNNKLQHMLEHHFGFLNEDDTQTTETRMLGKLLRPTLCLLTVDAFSEENNAWQHAIPAAAAIELLHNCTLIHDDVMDQDEKRHGRHTVWLQEGFNQAVLAGDFLNSLSIVAISKLALSDTKKSKITELLQTAALEVAKGQHLDLLFEGNTDITTDQYLGMIYLKTAMLIQVAIEIGATIAEVDENTMKNLQEYGKALGMAFQIADDMDIWQERDQHGKLVGNDIRRKKITYPIIYALSHANEEDRIMLQNLYKTNGEMVDASIEKVFTILERCHAREATTELCLTFRKEAILAILKTPMQIDDFKNLFLDAVNLSFK